MLKGQKKGDSAVNRNADLILQMVENNRSLAEIARTIGTNKRHVRNFVRSRGITKNFPIGYGGDRSPHWKGGRHVTVHGYVHIRQTNHPYKTYNGYVPEHRLVMEKHIGRYLNPVEVVHHKNGVKTDNRIENLQLFQSNAEHLRYELKGRVPKWTEDGKMRILEAADRKRKRTRDQSKPGALRSPQTNRRKTGEPQTGHLPPSTKEQMPPLARSLSAR